jgi:hypothetical protein
MSDYSWVGPVIQGVSGAVAAGQRNDAAGGNEQLMRDAYLRALGLLQSGELNYNPAQASGVGPSAMQGVYGDTGAKLAEQEALSRLQEASTEGYNTIDRAAINRAMSDANMNERGQREAALARLDPNSGAALAAKLSAQQSGANRANQSALDIAAGSRMKALQSLGMFSGAASRMRNEGFGEEADRAKAQDAIARFNAETSRFNSNSQNDASQHNIASKLRAMDIASGATGAYGKGMLNRGDTNARGTYGMGKSLTGIANAANENKSNTNTTPKTTPNTNSNVNNTSTNTNVDMGAWGDYRLPEDDEDRYG